VVVGRQGGNETDAAPPVFLSELVDTGLAARMAANSLRVTLRDAVWQRRHLGARGQVGESQGLRLMVWTDSRDDQPGMVAIWDMAQEAPCGETAYGAKLARPVLVIGRNMRTGEHFVMRYAPGEWLERLQQVEYTANRSRPAS
jgi:hypothetical protein